MNQALANFKEKRVKPYKETIESLPSELKTIVYRHVPDAMVIGMEHYFRGIKPNEIRVDIESPVAITPEEVKNIAELMREGFLIGYEIVSLLARSDEPAHYMEEMIVYLFSGEHFDEEDYRRRNRQTPWSSRGLIAEKAKQN